jgi:hypothetical protein
MSDLKSKAAIAVAVLFATRLVPAGAVAITAEVAKKCDALVAREFPLREPGIRPPEARKAPRNPKGIFSTNASRMAAR